MEKITLESILQICRQKESVRIQIETKKYTADVFAYANEINGILSEQVLKGEVMGIYVCDGSMLIDVKPIVNV